MSPPLYNLQEFDGPILLNFPHSGTFIPENILCTLNETGRSLVDTDWHVPRLYEFAKTSVSWLQANYSRYVVDLNRDPEGTDLYPGQEGTGLCPISTFAGDDIYNDGCGPDTGQINRRKQQFFIPYHQQLRTQIERIKSRLGFCILLDCHSIKSRVPRLFNGVLPDFNLGTFSGASCGTELAEMVVDILASSGFSFVRDQRFKGGWITRNYGRPSNNIHALQLEISQQIYMNEDEFLDFDDKQARAVQKPLKSLIANLNNWHGKSKETMR